MRASSTIVVASTSTHLSTRLGGEFVILNLVDENYYGVDKAGARIWELIQEPRTLGEIVERICEEYDVERNKVEQDVDALVSELLARSLVTISA